MLAAGSALRSSPLRCMVFRSSSSAGLKGLTQCAETLPGAGTPPTSRFGVNAEAFMHLLRTLLSPGWFRVGADAMPVMIVRFYIGAWEMFLLESARLFPHSVALGLHLIARAKLHPKT